MSIPKKTKPQPKAPKVAPAEKAAEPILTGPTGWVEKAEAFARHDPVKAVASAVSAGFLLNLLPVRAIIGALGAVVFAMARPLLLFLGLLKAWEICPVKKEEPKD